MKLSGDLKRAIEHARQALGERDRIVRAIEQAVALQPGAEANLESKMEALGEREADAALQGQTADEALRGELADARNVVEGLSARISGLRKRLARQEDEILTAKEEMLTQRAIHFDAERAEFDREYAETANALIKLSLKGHALATCLGVPSWLDELRIVSPLTGQRFAPELSLKDGAWVTAPVSAGKAAEELRDVLYGIEAAARQIEAERRERPKPEPVRPSQSVQPGILPPHRGPVEEPPIYGRDMIGRATLS